MRNLELALIVTVSLPRYAFINNLSQSKVFTLLLEEDVCTACPPPKPSGVVPVLAFSCRQPRESGAVFFRLASSDLGQCRACGRNMWRKEVGGVAPFGSSFMVRWFKLLVGLCPNPVLLQGD